MKQSPLCLWLTGYSGAGKSTLSMALHQCLLERGYLSTILDGDDLRCGLCSDLTFSDADRVENIRRAGEVARLMVDAGLIVLVGLISPFNEERQKVRQRFEGGRFVEVFVDAPLDECERRDVKGLYARARRGEIPAFTGIASPYEPPQSPEIHLKTQHGCIDEHVGELLAWVERFQTTKG